MQRTASGLCIAAVLGLVASAAAQQTTTPQSGTRTNTQTAVTANDMRDVTITGCLQRGADGTFMLTNVQTEASASVAGSSTGTGTATGTNVGASSGTSTSVPGATSRAGQTTAGTSAGTATGSGTATGTSGSTIGAKSATAATNWMLHGGNNLAPHVGHKIQVTGRSSMMGASPATSSTASAPRSGTATTGGTTSGTVSSGATASVPGTNTNTGVSAGASVSTPSTMANMRNIDVQSFRMISATCP